MKRSRPRCCLPVLGWAVLGSATLGFLSGCKASLGDAGQSRIEAAYRLGTLRATLPDSVRVPAVTAAAQAALIGRGYSIFNIDETAERARVTARAPGAGEFESTLVTARIVPAGTEVAIDFNPLGDEAASRALLDAILRRLGL